MRKFEMEEMVLIQNINLYDLLCLISKTDTRIILPKKINKIQQKVFISVLMKIFLRKY